MGTLTSSSEIVESREDLNSELKMKGKYSIEDEINRLFQAIEIRASNLDKAPLRKMKRPMRPSLGIGISEPVSLKQALRGLCISQASEMAAMKRISGFSEAGNIRRLYRAVVVEPNRSGERNFLEISLVPDNKTPDSTTITTLPQNLTKPVPPGLNSNDQKVNTSGGRIPCWTSLEVEEIASPSVSSKRIGKSRFIFRGKNNNNKKPKTGLKSNDLKVNASSPEIPVTMKLPQQETTSETIKKSGFIFGVGPKSRCPKVKASSQSSNSTCTTSSPEIPVTTKLPQQETTSETIEKSGFIFGVGSKSRCPKVNASSQSSNSTCTTSSTEEFGSSRSGRVGHLRPHMSKDSRWGAIRRVQDLSGPLSLSHFKLIRRLGCGDIGTVYLAELTGTSHFFALKVMDNESLETRKKLSRAQTEREVMEILDHPFLPTLFGHFVSEKLSCLVMEFCPGGDLHVLRQKQPTRTFSEQAARFYVAEVLVALEYLHMLGVVYRDLKPENVLVREDGHVMLSDFDLSLRAAPANPTVINPSPPPLVAGPAKRSSTPPCSESGCIEPICLHPTWHISCFTPKQPQPNPPAQVSLEPTAAWSDSFVGTHEYLSPEIVRGEGHGSAVDWWTLGVFLFELLYGETPFKGSADKDTLVNVVSKGLKFPETPMVSFEARDLIRGLLAKDPIGRFGSERGAAEIKRHPFFEGINWALIRCSAPPELPKFGGGTKELEVSPELREFEVF